MDHAGTRPDHVGDGVERAHLVEVHVLGRHAVDPPLGVGQPREHVVRQRADVLVQAGAGQQPLDVTPRAVVLAVLDLHVAPGRGEAGAEHPFLDEEHLSGSDLLDGVGHHAQRHTGVRQRTQHHVAAGPRGGVDPADHEGIPSTDRASAGSGASAGTDGVRTTGDPRREDPGAVPVVDVHDRDAGSAGVEHGQQGGQTAEGGAVPHAGRHRHERDPAQAADHAGQGALHAGDHDEAVGGGEPVAGLEQAVQPGDAHVVDAHHPGAVHGGGQRRLGRHRRVGGARR